MARVKRSGFPGDGPNQAGVEIRRRSVFNPDAGRIEVRRFPAGQWQTRAEQAVGPATVFRTSAMTSMVDAATAAFTSFSTPVAERLTESSVR